MNNDTQEDAITQDFEITVGLRRTKTVVSTSELLRLINGGAAIASIRQIPRTTSLAAQDGLVDALRKISSGRSSVTECSLIARAALASIEVKS